MVKSDNAGLHADQMRVLAQEIWAPRLVANLKQVDAGCHNGLHGRESVSNPLYSVLWKSGKLAV
jgi:hypothetical protein